MNKVSLLQRKNEMLPSLYKGGRRKEEKKKTRERKRKKENKYNLRKGLKIPNYLEA